MTNVDDIVLLALLFAQGVPPAKVVLGQYAGFVGILLVAITAALGATLLPASVLPVVLIGIGVLILVGDWIPCGRRRATR